MESWDLLEHGGNPVGLKGNKLFSLEDCDTLSRLVELGWLGGACDNHRIKSRNRRFLGQYRGQKYLQNCKTRQEDITWEWRERGRHYTMTFRWGRRFACRTDTAVLTG